MNAAPNAVSLTKRLKKKPDYRQLQNVHVSVKGGTEV